MPKPGKRTQPTDESALFERDTELASAVDAVDALCGTAPIGGLLVFRGGAGLGKTAMLSEVRRLAAGRCTVWSARGGETVTSVPFHVVRQLFQPALTDDGSTDARELLGDRYDIVGPALGIASPGGPNADPQGVRDTLDVLVDRLAALHGPLVLVVDDAHWADLETLAWLSSFAQRPTGGLAAPVLVVVAYRTEEAIGQTERFLQTLGTAATVRVTVRALTSDATASLTRATLGEHADDPFCREIWAVTGGNAYETVELLAKVQDSELDPVEGSAHALRALGASAHGKGLIIRLEELGTATTKFAWAAAILGTDISMELAMGLAMMDHAEATECADQLRNARILMGTDPLEFVHPLIAGSVYRAIPSAVRTAMHGRAAWSITRSGRGASAAAPHLLEVHPDNDAELVAQLREAAAEHLAMGAPEAARRCLERALLEPPLPKLGARVLYETGCATLLTSPATTVAHLRAALDTPDLDPALRVDVVFRLVQALAHNNQTKEAAQVVAAEAARPGPDRMRLQAAHFLWEGVRGVEEDSSDRSRRLTEIAGRVSGRDNAERVLLMLRAFDGAARGESASEIEQITDRALLDGRLALGIGWTNTEWGFEPPALLGLACIATDQLDRAEELFEEALRSFEISGWSGGHLALAYAFLGYVHRRRGRLIEAETHLRESLRLADRVGNGLPMHWVAVSMLIDTLLARGHVRGAAEMAEHCTFAPPYSSSIVVPDAPSVRGRLLLALGRKKEGVAELQSAGEALMSRSWHSVIVAQWACDLAPAIAEDDPVRAAELASYVRDRAERLGTHTAIGVALCCQAALAEGSAAVELLARAVGHLESSPCAYELAIARVEYGIAARSAAELERGLALAERCGADGLAARAREVLGAGGLSR